MPMIDELFRSEPSFIKIRQGDYLFREGDPSQELMYVLVSGKADIRIGHHTVEEAGAGAIVGEMGIIQPSEPRSASVLILTDCEFVEIGPKRFNFLVAEAPQFALEIMRVLARRLRRADGMLE